MVPACGALWGVTTPRPTLADLEATQKQAGRSFDFVYRFHDIDDVIPTAEERHLSRKGMVLHLSIDSRDHASPDRTTVPWAAVSRGAHDATLRKQAQGIASLGVPVFVTFEHEPDQSQKAAVGTPAEFVAAWRHVHDLFAREGATNVVWVWVVTGWAPSLEQVPSFWPGREFVDWVSWDVYNASGCRNGQVDASRYTSFDDLIGPVYAWFEQPSSGIPSDLPIMISETGTSAYPGDPRRTGDWYRGIPEALKNYPRIKAVTLWNHEGTGATCDFRFGGEPEALAGLRDASSRPLVNTQRLTDP